jgi:hypothetical protein
VSSPTCQRHDTLLLLLLFRRLSKIIQDWSDHFTPGHAAAAVSLLAGMVTGKALPPDVAASVYKGPAAKAARVFEAKVQQATLTDCAR